MERISSFPYSFRIHGDTIELQKNTFRRIDGQGIETRLSLVGDVIGSAVNEAVDEWAIAVQYNDGVFCISKKNGWFGPFEKVEAIQFDEGKGISIVQGVKDGKSGDHPLVK
ncbi:MAG: hypothetical protein ACYTHN_11910 [Planctomycetota bacterium]|jgi:hypothetical protein